MRMIDSDKFFDQDIVKSNLTLSALYLLAYELLKDAIVVNIKRFFSFEFTDDGKAIPDEQYKNEVTRVHKDILYASCLWLQHNGVITETEVEEIQNIRKHRNQIAHELPRLLSDTDLNLNPEYFLQIRKLLEKIEMWWIKNVDIPTNSEFDDVEVDEKDIHPGRVIFIDYVISVVVDDYMKQRDNVKH